MEVKTIYIYLNVIHPIVSWETYRGILISPTSSAGISLWYYSLLRNGTQKAIFQNEMKLEEMRSKYFPHQTSRLTGLFFFETEDNAAKARQEWSSTHNHFNQDCLAELGLIYQEKQITKVDSKWISHYLNKESVDPSWMFKYWEGTPYDNEPTWESFVNGRAVVYGTELRKRCYDLISEKMPKALGMLELARITAYLGSDLGHIAPFMTKIRNNKYHIECKINFIDAENWKFLEKLGRYLKNNKETINLKDVNFENGLTMPDLTPLNFDFKI